jgi:hypothetical protein
MNGSGRNELWAATFALALAACTPFDTAVPDGGDGSTGAKGGATGANGDGAAGSNSVGAAGSAGGAAGAPVAGTGGAANGGSGGDAGTNVAGAGASGTAGGAAGSPTDAGSDAHVDVAPEVGGGDLKMTGAVCSKASECASNFCVDGVCCSTACTQGCMACSTDKTGSASGTCAPVKAGMPHANDCIAADPTSCGHDGKCDGAGACSYFSSGTPCGPEACSDGLAVSSYSPPRACDGKGTCKSSTPTTCGNGAYRCAGTKCNVNCSGQQQCSTGAYCSATACLQRKEDGQLCVGNNECVSNACSGRCCLGCKCTQPSSANLLRNPGFDKDPSGWTVSANGTLIAGGALWTSEDVERCPYSGALAVSVSTSLGSSELDSCAKNLVLDGNFNFGVRAFVVGDGSAVCGVRFYASTDCSGTELGDDELNPISGTDWQAPSPETTDPFISVSGGHSLLFFCNLSGASDYYFDQPYVSKIPANY